MQRLDLTLPTAAQNLALDEALLDWAEDELPDGEFLRLWESPQPMVVAGRSSRIQKEINEDACRRKRIPILRRSSGGGAIVAGPGCLMYALVLSFQARPELKDIGRAHAFILGKLATSLATLLSDSGTVACAGTSDLVMKQGAGSREQRERFGTSSFRKFSGNCLRVKRTHLLYHGTLLYAFDLALIEACLQMPPRQPEYRNARAHDDFVMNLPVSRQQLVDAVDAAWPTDNEMSAAPMSRVEELVATRFSRDDWNYEFA